MLAIRLQIKPTTKKQTRFKKQMSYFTVIRLNANSTSIPVPVAQELKFECSELVLRALRKTLQVSQIRTESGRQREK